MAPSKYTDLILAVPGILFTHTVPSPGLIPPRTVKTILNSRPWRRHERGQLSRKACSAQVETAFGLTPGRWTLTERRLRASRRPDTAVVAAVRRLRRLHPRLRVHALTAPYLDEQLRPALDAWGIFDNILCTSAAGKKKDDDDSNETPLRHLLESDAVGPAAKAIFVDNCEESVVAAGMLGMEAVAATDARDAVRRLRNLLGDPVSRGMGFLRRNAGALWSETSRNVKIKENFSQLLILSCVGERNLVALENKECTWQYFIGRPTFTDAAFPKDADTTSLALITLDPSKEEKDRAMNEILQHRNSDDLPTVYLDRLRPRFCPYVCANVLRLFHINGRGHELRATLHHLCRALKTGAYELSSRYYCQADWMLYYLADLCGRCHSTDRDNSLQPLRTLVETRVAERLGSDRDTIGAALRVLAVEALRRSSSSKDEDGADVLRPRLLRDIKTLREAQRLDGGWDLCWAFRYGSVAVKIGSRGLTTALAVAALRSHAESHASGT